MRNVANTGAFVHRDSPAGPDSAPLALLLAPPVYDFALYDLFLKPYGLCRLGAWLHRAGFRVALVNALDYTDPRSLRALGPPRRRSCGTGKLFRQVVPAPAALARVPRRFARYGIVPESLEERLAALRPDLVLISGGMTYWYPGVVESVRLVRRLHPGVPVLLGGIYPTLCPEHALAVAQPDYVIPGDAQERLPAVLQRLGLPAPAGAPAEELALLPEAIWQAGVVRLNRGCPLSCSYCASPAIHPRFVPGEPARAVESTLALSRRFGTRHFAFYDDALLAGKGTGLEPYLEGILSAGLELRFYLPNGVHARWIDDGAARLMHRAGFQEIRLGYESGRAEFHETLDRKLQLRDLPEAVDCLAAAGFARAQVRAYVLAGLPRQPREQVEESIRSAAALGIRVEVAEFSPVPGSALWEACVSSSELPLAEEPLVHNNSVLPLEWEGLRRADLERLKRLARELSPPAPASGGTFSRAAVD